MQYANARLSGLVIHQSHRCIEMACNALEYIFAALLDAPRVGAPWRDLPKDFGNWNSVFQRFRRWVRSGVFDQLFEALSADADFEYVIVDGTIVRVHQHGSGARGGTKTQAIRRSRGGLTTKIVALVDALSCGSSCCRDNDMTAWVSPRF